LDKLAVLRTMLLRARGLIFDFDGLLADSERFHYMTYDEVFRRHGHALDQKEYDKYWTSLGHGVKGEIERHDLDLDPLVIRREKMPIFTRYCEDGSIRLFEEAREMIGVFSRMGKRMAIASGTPATDVRAVLRNAGVDGAFEAVLGSDTVPRVKPAPDVFLKTCEALGLAPAECLVFEDAEKGMLAAIEARIPVIVIRTPPTEGFDFSRADLALDSHAETVSLLRTLGSGV
jgi:beta-phosphoglucomutase-like phosphatase (HAD superfamily)